jgi:DNA repair protein RecN (Recombination protein N)
MLEHLRVANLGVLADASIDPSPGFTVITGETGAGKTLLLGGLRLILGGQPDNTAVGPGSDRALVDGLFLTAEGEIGASRTVPRAGRSRAHIEGSIVSAAVLGDRLGSMIEIVGQHDQLSITRPSHLLEILDSSLGAKGCAAKDAYRGAWGELQDVLERRRNMGGDQIELTRELDLARYQANEIEGAGLTPGLDDELEAAVSRLRNVEEIREHLSETVNLSETMSEAVGEVVARLRKAAGLDPSLGALSSEAEALADGVSEMAREARTIGDALDADPARLDELDDRLTALGDLKRKYGRTLEEVVAFGEKTRARAGELESLIDGADQIESLVSELRGTVVENAIALSAARTQAADRMSADVLTHLRDLGLGSAVVRIEVQSGEPAGSGADRVEMWFASDTRLEPGPIGAVASGGELSRLVLAMRLATRSASASTLVFDEVDTGIGGKTALAMGQKLAELADATQVLCVTHLAQVAAHADTHYVVERAGDGAASVRLVEGETRVTEITRMLAGQPESEAGKTAAAELLETALK